MDKKIGDNRPWMIEKRGDIRRKSKERVKPLVKIEIKFEKKGNHLHPAPHDEQKQIDRHVDEHQDAECRTSGKKLPDALSQKTKPLSER